MKLIVKLFTLILIACLNICIAKAFNKKDLKNLQPDSIDVIHYSINLDITDFTNSQITGNTILEIVSKVNNVSLIKLDLLKLTIDSIKQDGNLISGFSYNDTLLKINCLTPLSAGDTTILNIYYHGKPVTDPSGFGGFYFTANYAYNIGVAFKDYPHNYGRVWYPCVDDFIDRAKYDFYITVKNIHKAVCGGTLISVTDNGNNTNTYHWDLRDEIPTYLSSVAVGPYKVVNDTFNGINGQIPIALYVYPNDTAKAKNSFINLKSILTAYEQDFGAYKWERVGYVGTPFSGGAMEHTTNIAYPSFAIDGSLSYEGLYAHELSHQWFGDLVTCSTDKDMWINEGWATFCESIYVEKLYGNPAYKDYVRSKHNEVLRYLHIEDSTYRAIYGIPPDYTYSSTVYEKGADVVHSIRGYLGDSLFFAAVKNFLSTYSFDNASSEDLKNSITNYTGISMTDFFDFWVYSPGFTHYSVDSFKVVNNATDYNVTVYVHQKLKATNLYANSNRVEITFMDSNWVQQTKLMQFSGEFGSQTFTIPINPVNVMIDINEKISDATTDFYQTIKTTGNNYFKNILYFKTNVISINDSAFLRVTHNWVAPDTLRIPSPNLVLANNRYWKIEGILPDTFVAKGYFWYDKRTTGTTGYLDNDFIIYPTDSLVLMYRKNTSYNWDSIPFKKSGNNNNGWIYIDTLKLGEYAFARKDKAHSIIINSTGATICHGDSLRLYTYNIPGYNYKWLKNDTIITGAVDTSYFVKQTGNYSLIIINSSYSDTSVSTYINVIFTPKPTIVQNGDTLISSSTNGNQWYLNGSAIPGETVQTLVINQTGNYQLIVNINNCFSEITDTATYHFSGINNILQDKSFISIFPNPSKSSFTINYKLTKNGEIKIFNTSGKIVFYEKLNAKKDSLKWNPYKLSKGIYIVELFENSKLKESKKVVYN